MSKSPIGLTIRSYNVGFGDCYLLSFEYPNKKERHVLIDFGSTGLPKGVSKSRMMEIANNITQRTKGTLHIVVATHRHKDHISGFETKKGGKGTGDVIRSLKPKRVVQPWTEDPRLAPTATAPPSNNHASVRAYISSLATMNEFARQIYEMKFPRSFTKQMRSELSFLGESNLANLSAIKNLMNMAPNSYVHFGSKSGMERLLPGVRIDVLGPPTVKQADQIRTQRSKDPDEFWHMMVSAPHNNDGDGNTILFPDHVRASGRNFPITARWIIYHLRNMYAEQLLQIVRIIDKALNNTSVILLFRIGKKTLLFPGDAQIENWQYALDQPKIRPLLKKVDLYKVGHHGSLNATPKSLWRLFDNRNSKAGSARLISVMSTMEGKHGHEASNTEVPRRTLVNALLRETDHFSTQMLSTKELYRDFKIVF